MNNIFYKLPFLKHKPSIVLFGIYFVALSIFLFAKTSPSGGWAYSSTAEKDPLNIGHQAHLEYLNCYGLRYGNKEKCITELNKKHISKNYLEDTNYLLSFQYASEKLGFKGFLNSQNKSCDHIQNGPLFNNKTKLYHVTCTSGEEYLVQYDNKSWSLKEKH
jgi:hypothetical protein